MINTVEAVIDERGNVELPDRLRPSVARRALVTILGKEPESSVASLRVLR
jgi:hypothetical protein